MRLFDLAISERLFSADHRAAFERYLADDDFRDRIESCLLMPQRISLGMLAHHRPDGIGDRVLKSRLYDLRFRFRDALSELRREHDEHPFRSFSGRAGRPSEPSRSAWQTGAGATTNLSRSTGRHQHTIGETA